MALDEKTKFRLAQAGTILCAFLCVMVLFTRDLIAILILLPLGIILHKYKTKNKEKLEQLNDLSTHSFVFFVLLPSAIILLVFVYLIFWKLAPAIVQSL